MYFNKNILEHCLPTRDETLFHRKGPFDSWILISHWILTNSCLLINLYYLILSNQNLIFLITWNFLICVVNKHRLYSIQLKIHLIYIAAMLKRKNLIMSPYPLRI